jgi:hypothetical protein
MSCSLAFSLIIKTQACESQYKIKVPKELKDKCPPAAMLS